MCVCVCWDWQQGTGHVADAVCGGMLYASVSIAPTSPGTVLHDNDVLGMFHHSFISPCFVFVLVSLRCRTRART
jgi:hypothetical protein